MRSSVVIAVVAGMAIGASAYAGDDVAVPVESVRVVPRECYAGPLFPKDAGPRDVGLVYDNTAASGFTNGANPPWVIDDFSLSPGTASGGVPAQLITGMAFGFAVRGTTGLTRDFDVLVEFFDSYDSLATVTPAWINSLGSFRVAFTGVGQNAAWTTNLIDLTGLTGGGIQLNDHGGGVSLKFVETGTTTLVTGVLVTPFMVSNIDAATFADVQQIGADSAVAWRDVTGDGLIPAADARTFAFPPLARFYMQLEGMARCPADFNNDGFVDGIDYDSFNAAFETLCF